MVSLYCTPFILYLKHECVKHSPNTIDIITLTHVALYIYIYI